MTASELSLIKRIAATSALRPGTSVGIGDDAAVLDGTGPVVVTQDLLVEDVHFRLPTSPEDLGHKALAVNLSDIAAMGATPVAAVVGLILPPEREFDVGAFYAGMETLAERTGVTVAGGDISRGRELGIAVCAMGTLSESQAPLLRSGALPGDRLVVTGPLGGSEAGRALIEGITPTGRIDDETRTALVGAHLRPEPDFAAAAVLRRLGAHAVMDCSDGLLLDAERICEASGCGAFIDLERIPVAPGVSEVAAARGVPTDVFAATSGEDYRLIAAVPPDTIGRLGEELPEAAAVGFFAFGTGAHARRRDEPVPLERLGYTHDV